MSSERQRKAGYVLPAQLTGHPLVCLTLAVPDVPEYRAAVRGALNELGKWWAWEKSGYGDTRASQAATYWRHLLEDTLQIGACDTTMFNVRQNDALPCRLEKTEDGVTWVQFADLRLCPPKIKAVAGRLFLSTDGGATWDPVEDTTYEEYDWRQDEPLRPARSGDNKRCLAAANAVAVFVELHREIVAWYQSQGTLLQIGMAVSVAIAIMFPGGWPVVAGGLLAGAGAQILLWTQALTTTAFTQEVQDQLRCIFWTWAGEDGRWSQAAFDAVLTDVQGKTGDMWRLLEIYLGEIGGYTGLNNAGTTTSIATADCGDCDDTWCVQWGSSGRAFLDVFTLTYGTNQGTYIGTGTTPGGNSQATVTYTFTTPAFITSVRVRARWRNLTSQPNATGPYSVVNGIVRGSNSSGAAGVYEENEAYPINANVSGLVEFGASGWGRPSNGGYSEILEVEIRGTGPSPFGMSNCE